MSLHGVNCRGAYLCPIDTPQVTSVMVFKMPRFSPRKRGDKGRERKREREKWKPRRAMEERKEKK